MKRRELLGTSSIVLGSLVAGCSSSTSESSGEEPYHFSNWLHADHEPAFGYTNFEKAESEVKMGGLKDYFGIDEEDVASIVTMPQISGDASEFVLEGDFSKDEVIEHLEEESDAEPEGEYGGYDILEAGETIEVDHLFLENHHLGVSSDTIVATYDHEDRIDARNGEATRPTDEDEDFELLFSNMPDAENFEEPYIFSGGEYLSMDEVKYRAESLLKISPPDSPGLYHTNLVFEDEEYVTEENIEDALNQEYEDRSGVRLENIVEEDIDGKLASLEWEYIPVA